MRHRIRWIMGDEATADVGVSCGDRTDACVVASDDRERVCPVCGATLRLTWDVRLRESRRRPTDRSESDERDDEAGPERAP